jgi:hypothetical protein
MKAVRLVLALAALAMLQPELALAQNSAPPAEGGGVVNRSRDCHRNVIRHRIYGRMLAHRHVGSSCRVEIVRERDDRRQPRCIIVDGKRICRKGD